MPGRTPPLPEAVRALLSLAVLATAVTSSSRADEKPLWEFGFGAGMFFFNDYRGSDTAHAYPIPVPYFVYRGQIFKSDQEGLRGRFVDLDRVELNLSISGTTPVRNDSARHGMPDLKPTLEMGASLNVHLWRSSDKRFKLDLRLPARAAVTVEASPRVIGVFAEPHINLDIAQFRGAGGWKLGLLAGPLFADRRYNDYFYTVSPQYATADRPAYEAHGGYAGMQTLVSLTRRFPNQWCGFFVRHDTLGGASFTSSPLVKTNSYWSAGFGVIWVISRSSQNVESDD
jgi:outer membrane scaffolding protein for murein synthesis (MipA/OmpV family)